MEAWKGESYDLLSFMYHVCGNKIIVIVIVVKCSYCPEEPLWEHNQ